MKRFGPDHDIRLELGGALAPPLARGHGATRAELRRHAREGRRVVAGLLGRDAASGFLQVVRRQAGLRAVEQAARRWRRRRPADLVHVGIGGSALGAETLFRALAHPFHNALPDRRRRGPRVHFVDNVDPERIAALLETLDLRRTLVHVVSKSGTTVETAAGFQLLRERLARSLRGGWADHTIFTTGRGALRELARAEGVEVLDFPEDVGGRYSVFTASGLLTPAVAGVDVATLLGGARRMLARIRRAPAGNPAALAAALAFLLETRRDKPIQVLMPYADALEPLARWYVQLAAESLGKRRRRGRGVGPTPLPARGTSDQHSQVQLFVEGPADKLVTFVVARRARRELRMGGGEPAPYLRGVRLGDLLRAEQEGTAIALARAGRPTTTWVLPAVDPWSLGQLLLALELQTAIHAALLGVDAFDQPGVEAGKLAAFALIGRQGYEAERRRIARARPPRWTV